MTGFLCLIDFQIMPPGCSRWVRSRPQGADIQLSFNDTAIATPLEVSIAKLKAHNVEMKSRGKKKDSYPLRRSKAYERNLKNFKILVAYDPFQKDVEKLRKELMIDANGNFEGDSKTNWSEWASQEGDEITGSKSFIQQEALIQKQFSDGKMGLRQRHRHMRLLYSKVPWQNLEMSIDTLIEKYHLPLNYKNAIRVYVISGEISAPRKNWEPNKVSGWDDADKARSLSITIFSQLAKDELNELNDYIDWIGKKTLPKYSDFENADLAIKSKKAREAIYRDPDTGKEYRSSFADIAEEYLDDQSKGTRVRGVIRDLEQQQKSRFTKRAKK
jgi:hypothetical protein